MADIGKLQEAVGSVLKDTIGDVGLEPFMLEATGRLLVAEALDRQGLDEEAIVQYGYAVRALAEGIGLGGSAVEDSEDVDDGFDFDHDASSDDSEPSLSDLFGPDDDETDSNEGGYNGN